jgi:hypothetical protein
MKFSGGSLACMFPYKVMSKKTSKLSKGYLVANSTVCIPAAISEEVCFKSQIDIVIELLLQNKAKVLERVEKDLINNPKSLTIEFPSIVKTLQEANMVHHYLKNYHANVVDEYGELMAEIFSKPCPNESNAFCCEQLEEVIESPFHESSASATSYENLFDDENGAEVIVERNHKFLNLPLNTRYISMNIVDGKKTTEKTRRNNNYEKISKWVEENSEETINLFDSDYEVLMNYGLLESSSGHFQAIKLPREMNQSEITRPQFKSKEYFSEEQQNTAKLELSPTKKVNTEVKPLHLLQHYDYSYYEYQYEKAEFSEANSSANSSKCINTFEPSHKASRDDHHEVEVSTKSEDLPEESNEKTSKQPIPSQPVIEETKKLSKTAIKKMKKQKKKEEAKFVVAVQEDPPSPNKKEVSTTVLDQSPFTKVDKSPKMNKNIPIEPAYSESEAFSFDPELTKVKLKEIEKQKQASKDSLKDQLLRISEEQDLDEFEKRCTTEINNLETLTKKMKQKARRRLRQEIDEEKAKRKQVNEEQIIKEEEDDDYEYENNMFKEFLRLGNKEEFFNDKILRQILPEPDLHLIKSYCRIK